GKGALGDVVRWVRAPDRVLILNHPRGERTGYFDNIGLDTRAGSLKELVTGFDAIEVFGGKDVNRVEAVLRDWLAPLHPGVTLTALRGSGTHPLAAHHTRSPSGASGARTRTSSPATNPASRAPASPPTISPS